MRNLRLDICYEGSRYRGWQRLSGTDNTIQGKIETALSRILDEPIEISGSGRTDAGVHARGQVANFHCESNMTAAEILANLRRYLPEDIGIYSCKDVSPRFHARLSAKEKTYLYRIWNSEEPCVFQRKFVAVFPEKLDVDAMRKAAAHLCGEHDFAAFCATGGSQKTTVRRLFGVKVSSSGGDPCQIEIEVSGEAFLYNMVRIIAGTLLYAGQGKIDPKDIKNIIDKCDRSLAGKTLPAKGLTLEEVYL